MSNHEEVAKQQAALDQMWKSIEENSLSLEQIWGLCSSGGIIHSYLTVLLSQVNLNKLKRSLE